MTINIDAPMYEGLSKRQLLIYKAGFRNGFSVGSKNTKNIKVKYEHDIPTVPVHNVNVFEKIIKNVCLYFKVPTSEIYGDRKFRYLVIPRSMIINLARECTRLSYPELSRLLDKDHTTMMFHVKSRMMFRGIWKHDNNHNIYAHLKGQVLSVNA